MRLTYDDVPGPWPRSRLFGIRVDLPTLDGAVTALLEAAAQGTRARVVFLNAHCVNVAFRDWAYWHALEQATHRFADGAGMRLAARVAGRAYIDNVNGTDLFPLLCERAAQSGTALYLLGAEPGVADETARRMTARYPGLVIAGTSDGFGQRHPSERELLRAIDQSGAQIVLVALGVPLQEKWIMQNAPKLRAPVVMEVGGLFDFYSGRRLRAPLWLRRIGLEWSWRLALEPKRLWRRYLIGNLAFLARLTWLALTSPGLFLRSEPAAGRSAPEGAPSPRAPAHDA